MTTTTITTVEGRFEDGREHAHHVLDSGDGGIVLTVAELGAAVRSLRVPDSTGRPRNVVLGYRHTQDALSGTAYLGSTVGRFANRLAGGTFEIDGVSFVVPRNEGTNALHGGPDGFDRCLWRPSSRTPSSLTLSLTSPHDDQGFPGRLVVEVTYTVMGQRVSIAYRASTDAPTVVNVTNHSYFNLDGEQASTIDGHRLLVDADHVLPVTPHLVPTGELRNVTGSPFDLREPTLLGPRVRQNDAQLVLTRGIDHCFVVRGDGMRRHAVLRAAESGILLTILSDQPGIQVYSGNFLDGSVLGTSGHRYRQGAGIALETQHFPDSPNHPAFPSTVLRPGSDFVSETVWDFAVEPTSPASVQPDSGRPNGRR